MPQLPRLTLIEPSGGRREVEIRSVPFRIGRQANNELMLRDSRISRQHAQIIAENGKYLIEDLGSRHGTFVNGEHIDRRELQPQDTIDFGLPDSFRLVYIGEGPQLGELLSKVEIPAGSASTSRELHHLGVLLEVAGALHGRLSFEDVLTTVVDAAIQVTHTERGVLLLAGPTGELEVNVARDARQGLIRPQEVEISSNVLKQVVNSRREVIVGDVGGESDMGQHASVVRLALRTVVAIPLEKHPVMMSLDSTVVTPNPELLGVLYLDSHAPSAVFSELDRQVLRSLAGEAAGVIENARLFALARAKEQMEHQLKIASEIQRRMLPKDFPHRNYFVAAGRTIACHEVGGDCYDVIELPDGRFGFVVGDVAGKGVSAALLASVLQGMFFATAALGASLDDVADRVNRYLWERSGEERYATLFYCVLAPNGSLEYLNAGHVTPLVRQRSGKLAALPSENFPLGMFDFAEYSSGQVRLTPGDFLVIYTDGVSEATNQETEMFGEQGLRAVLEGFRGETVEELLDTILIQVRAFTENAPQADDITLVVIQYRGEGEESVTLGD